MKNNGSGEKLNCFLTSAQIDRGRTHQRLNNQSTTVYYIRNTKHTDSERYWSEFIVVEA